MPDRLKNVIAAILDIPTSEIGDDASPETISQWDSVKQMDLMLAIEDEFNIRFNDDEMVTLTSYPAIKDAIVSRGATLS